jgi:hypothetical protein
VKHGPAWSTSRAAAPLALGVLCAAVALGCAAPRAPVPAPAAPAAAAAPAPSAAPEDEAAPRLPRSLRDLGLDAEQSRAAEAIARDLEDDLDPLIDASRELGRSLAGAARGCKGETPFVVMDAEATVRAGEPARRAVVRAIGRVHALLRPDQRAKLSARLLAEEESGAGEKADGEKTRSLGPELGLTLSQVGTMLARARTLAGKYEDRVEVWRSHYRHALSAFARADFDMAREPFAEAPVVELMTSFARDAFRLLVPILKPPQCEALGRLVDESLDEAQKKRLARRAERR